VQFKLTGRIDHSVTGIISTGKTDNYLSLLGQHIDNFTFSLITPLSSNNSYDWHIITYYNLF
jgi:hypothetical protein